MTETTFARERFASCLTCGIIVHVGYHGKWQDDKGQLHEEGQQVEESAELAQATGKHSEVPANAVPRRTARLSASVKIWQRLFLRLRDASRDGKETQTRATMSGRLTPPEHDHDGIAREMGGLLVLNG